MLSRTTTSPLFGLLKYGHSDAAMKDLIVNQFLKHFYSSMPLCKLFEEFIIVHELTNASRYGSTPCSIILTSPVSFSLQLVTVLAFIVSR